MKNKKVKLTKEQKEAKEIIKDLEKDKDKYPSEKKNILDWSMKELQTYIKFNTNGMKQKEKLKFAHNTMKRIEEEKKKRKIKN